MFEAVVGLAKSMAGLRSLHIIEVVQPAFFLNGHNLKTIDMAIIDIVKYEQEKNPYAFSLFTPTILCFLYVNLFYLRLNTWHITHSILITFNTYQNEFS